MRAYACLLCLLLAWAGSGVAMAQTLSGTVKPADWAAYKSRFIDAGGRVIDDANGNISHSEGQGYGLLLAYLANSKADFDLIWSFTKTELLLRDDGLAMWKWDPSAKPHITDSNNASDGDILIAYALLLAGGEWERNDFIGAAKTIIGGIGKSNVVKWQDRLLLLPGAKGFSETDRTDGPIINLSYWVFEAFPKFASIDKTTDWMQLSMTGVGLLNKASAGPRSLPTDWMSAKTQLKPAKGFPAEFGYNALRIPLYLMRARIYDRELLTRLRKGMTSESGQVVITDSDSGNVKETLSDAGYAIIPALVACVLDKVKLPDAVRSFEPSLYYPSTLHLLSLSFAHSQHPECL
ncbi:endoglucanase [Phyllobacterium sp. SYP-B3895]|uniref:glycosyl hydrolase family 8 n=1 Tax=Phyllobacterium sp. SYP-B3895 TaxID=2663240 RepID=UPI0012999A3F|nr:endoglucanase [Phyllobacterium sp. SYP-B3895]